MTEYPHVLAKIQNSPWMMVEDHLQTLLSIVDRRINGERLTLDDIKMEIATADHGPRDYFTAQVHNGVGILPLYGPIFAKANLLSMLSGASSLEMFQQDFNGLMNDPNVHTIVMDVDSPGGTADLVHETATLVREAREDKEIISVSNTLCGSAAYYIASQANKMYSTPSGMVGSIGVVTVHEDHSVRDANEGVKTTYITAGKYKAEGNDSEPLSEEAKDYRQTVVDELYGQFTSSVALGRGTSVEDVKQNYGEGRVFTAAKAKSVGMIDDIKTFDEVVGQALEPKETVPAAFGGAIAANAGRVRHGMEVADLEHSDPGTGQPPEPRQTGEVLGGTNRFELPEQPVPEPVTFEESIEGGRMDEELLTQLRTLLSLPDADENIVLARVRELDTSNRALEDAVASAGTARAFAEQFPEEAARMARLEAKDRNTAAALFSAGFEATRLVVGQEKFGFSANVLESIKDAHLKFATGEGTLETFEQAMKTIVSEGGFVNYENKGSDLEDTSNDLVATPGSQAARISFAEKVDGIKNAALADGKQLSHGDAVAQASREYPELAAAWATTKAS